LVFVFLVALAGALRAEQASLREYGPTDGLESLAVLTAVQDAEGFIWAGTENGLYRFDGQRFRRIGAEQGLSWVNALAAQADGLWVGTADGLWWWRGGELVSVRSPDGGDLKVFGRGALAPAPDGGLWVASHTGLHRLTPLAGGAGWQVARVGDGAAEPELRKLGGMLVLPDGALWFGCNEALCRMSQGRIDRFAAKEGVPAARWDRLLHASDGSLWARGGRYVLQLAPGELRFAQRNDANFEPDEAGFYPLVEDAQRRILTGMRNAMLRWDGRRWERFGAGSGLTYPGRLMALVSDRGGGLWLGAGGAGLMQWRGYGEWENWAGDGLPSDLVWRFVRGGAGPEAPLYVGTSQGVAVLDPKTRRFRALASDAAGAVDIGALTVDAQGTLWAGTWGGEVIRYAGSPARRGRVETAIPKDDTVYGLLPEDGFVVGLRRLYRWQPGRPAFTPEPLGEAEVGPGGFGTACRGPDGLWVGGSEGLSLGTGAGRCCPRPAATSS
jgi:ligand-binding sensor domain-containing protein